MKNTFNAPATLAPLLGASVIAAVCIAAGATWSPARGQNPLKGPKPPAWRKIPLLSPEAKAAGVSPGGEGGQWPRDLVVSATNPNFLLLAIDVGGLYRSLDGGRTWEQASVGWNARGANGFAIDPRNPRRVIGIGGNSGDFGTDWGKTPHGPYLSTDQAASWRQTGDMWEGFGGAVAIDASSFDAAKGYCTRAYIASPKHGVLRSDDGGGSWTTVSEQSVGMGLSGAALRLAVHPQTGTVYVGGKTGLFASGDRGATWTQKRGGEVWGLNIVANKIYASGSEGLFVSADNAQTWTALSSGGVDRDNGKPIQNVQVSPADPRRIAVWVQGDNWQWKRYASSDGGATFTASVIEKGLAPLPYNVRNGFVAWHPTVATTCWGLGGDWVTKSADGGKTYKWSNNGYNGVMLGGLFNFSAREPNTVFLAFQDYNGAFTTDGGTTWNYRDVSGKGWGGFCYGGYAVDKTVMWYGDADGWGSPRKLRVSRDNGATWATPTNASGQPFVWAGPDVSFADPSDPNVCFASNFRSADKGATWAAMPACDGVYIANPKTKALYGKKGDAVVRSSDKGATWTKIADVPGGVSDIAVDHVTGRIYVASEDKLKAWENGAWRTIETPRDQYNNSKVVTVAVDPVKPSIVYAGGPRNVYATNTTIVRSVDGGRTWENLTVTAPLVGRAQGGPHEVAAVRVHPVTRWAWVNGQCYGMWKIPPPGYGDKQTNVAGK